MAGPEFEVVEVAPGSLAAVVALGAEIVVDFGVVVALLQQLELALGVVLAARQPSEPVVGLAAVDSSGPAVLDFLLALVVVVEPFVVRSSVVDAARD